MLGAMGGTLRKWRVNGAISTIWKTTIKPAMFYGAAVTKVTGWAFIVLLMQNLILHAVEVTKSGYILFEENYASKSNLNIWKILYRQL